MSLGPADYEYSALLVLGVVTIRILRRFLGFWRLLTEPWPNLLVSEVRFSRPFGYELYGEVYTELRTKTELVRVGH